MNGESPDWMDRGAADGNSVQPDSDFGELNNYSRQKKAELFNSGF